MFEKIKASLKNEFWNKLLKNVTVLLFGNTAVSLLNFATMVLFIKVLSSEIYGFFVIAQQYMNLIDSILNFQSWQGVIKFGSESILSGKLERLYKEIKCGFFIDIITAVLGMIIGIVLIPIVSKIMGWNKTIEILCVLFSVEILFHIEGTSIGILRLYDRFKYFSIISSITALLQLLMIGGLFLIGYDSIGGYCVLYIIFDILGKIGIFVAALVILNEELGIRRVFKTNIKDIDVNFLKYTFWANISRIVDIPIGYFDVFIVGMLSYRLVAVYKVYKQIIQIFSKLTIPISAAILPQFTDLVAMGKSKEAYKKVNKIRNYMALLMLVAFLIVVFGGKTLLNLFLGAEFAEHILIFYILFLFYSFSFSYVAIHPYFAAIGKVKSDFFINVISNIIYVLFIILTFKKLDIYAVVLGTGLQFLIYYASKIYICERYLRRLGSNE